MHCEFKEHVMIQCRHAVAQCVRINIHEYRVMSLTPNVTCVFKYIILYIKIHATSTYILDSWNIPCVFFQCQTKLYGQMRMWTKKRIMKCSWDDFTCICGCRHCHPWWQLPIQRLSSWGAGTTACEFRTSALYLLIVQTYSVIISVLNNYIPINVYNRLNIFLIPCFSK